MNEVNGAARANPLRVFLPLVALLGGVPLPAAGQEGALVRNELAPSKRGYSLLLPPGVEAARNLPLVVYLHPSGKATFQDFQKDYWPLLRERSCLAALPESKGKDVWLAGEEKYVIDVIEDVQKRYGVDARKVILLGVSGGGQVALFLADHEPQRFRAVIAVSTNPVVVRGHEQVFFYPDGKALKTCPYLVVNPISEGSALMYWRQVQAKLQPLGASISILPALGEVGHSLPPPRELGPWLDEVLAGRQPAALEDPQRLAVARMFKACADALPQAIAKAAATEAGERLVKDGPKFRLSVAAPKGFGRSASEDAKDSAGQPITQIRMEHAKWPLYVRCDARATEQPMAKVLAAEEQATVLRGLLYQVYHRGTLERSGRQWQLRIGSTTYPDRRRGWVSSLFLHAAAAMAGDPAQWVEVLVLDETQEPSAEELAATLAATLDGLTAAPAPASGPAGKSR